MKRTFAIVCSLLILMSSLGITISAHYCGNEFQQQSVLGIPVDKNHTSRTCADQEEKNCCTQDSQQDNCCSSNRQFVESDIELFKTSQEDRSIDLNWHIELFSSIIFESISTSYVTPHTLPQIKQDRQVLYQSFLC